MSENWQCGECSTGFPTNAGKVTKEHQLVEEMGSYKEEADNVVLKLVYSFVRVFSQALTSNPYEVHCPNCGNVIVGK